MIKVLFKRILPHLLPLALFLLISFAYFYPLLEGKTLYQSDIIQFRGMAREILEHREETGEDALWTNTMFSGMPSYLIVMNYPYNLVKHVDTLLSLAIPRPAKYLFLSLIGFYILLLVFRARPWLAFAGALAFAFSTYFFIIEAAGHNTKAHAMSYMAPVLAGIILSFRGRIRLGAVVTGLFLALQLYANHLQITYYTLLIVLIYGIYELVNAIKNKMVPNFLRTVGILIIPVVLAVGVNFTNMYLVWEYGKYSTRGESELTVNREERTGGLDKGYILNDYSYGIAETMNLFIPDFMGGASSYDLGTGSEVYRVLSQQGIQGPAEIAAAAPAYWGPQRFTSGPVYMGAVVIFFFVLALFVVKGRYKWWLLTATILSILLAWGKHFMPLSEFFIDYFPGYDKFRTVSMILVIAGLTIPLLAMLGLKEMLECGSSSRFMKALKSSFFVAGGVALLFAVVPGLFLSFAGEGDAMLTAMGWPDFLIEAVKSDRESLLRSDALRSLIFVTLSAGAVYLYLKRKLPVMGLMVVVSILVLADMWPVNKRFLSSDDFVTRRQHEQVFMADEVDFAILQDEDIHYRVFNTAGDPFNDALTSYHHNSVGGYHGAKIGRYQDLIGFHLSRGNMPVLNMLNTKYFINRDEDGSTRPYRNQGALGNAWFVDSFRIVNSADEEILALEDFSPGSEAIVDIRFEDQLTGLDMREVSMTEGEGEVADLIELVSYSPDKLVYRSESDSDRLAVFSEIYYDRGWRAYINGEESDHFRVNYVLRAMVVPPGENEIEFRFVPRGYYMGNLVSLLCNIILLAMGGWIILKEVSRSEVSRSEVSRSEVSRSEVSREEV